MKKETIILVLITFTTFCFAQKEKSEVPTTPAKQSTTTCPTWNKKNKNSKAAYFEYLRSPKEKENRQTTLSKSQKIQSKEAVQTTENTAQKKHLIQSVKKNNASTNKSDKEIIVASKPEKKEIISEKKVDSSAINASTTAESKEETKDKNKKDDNKIKNKLTFMSRKTTKVHKHSNSKCPSF